MSVLKKRVYLVVMSLGGVALLVDRCLLPATVTATVTVPARVSAGPSPAARTPAPLPKPPPSSEAAPELSVPELPFPRNLPPWDPSAPFRDVFSPVTQETSADNSGEASVPIHGTCAAFVREHRLEAVFLQERLKIAVIDGRWLRLGESLDGCTLIEAGGNKVLFRCRDGETSLQLNSTAQPGEH